MATAEELVKQQTGLDVHISPGTNPNATPEEVAQEIMNSLERMRRGEFEEVDY